MLYIQSHAHKHTLEHTKACTMDCLAPKLTHCRRATRDAATDAADKTGRKRERAFVFVVPPHATVFDCFTFFVRPNSISALLSSRKYYSPAVLSPNWVVCAQYISSLCPGTPVRTQKKKHTLSHVKQLFNSLTEKKTRTKSQQFANKIIIFFQWANFAFVSVTRARFGSVAAIR